MISSSPAGDRKSSNLLSLERFELMLDAYGAAAARWPEEERESAEQLLRESPHARELLEHAAMLDEDLDCLPTEPPSLDLRRRVLARAPRPRVRHWRGSLLAFIPVAAAAGLAVWLSGRSTPIEPPLAGKAIQVGEYTSPTDVLLGSIGVDVIDSVPKIGCSDSELGCARPAAEPLEKSEQSRLPRTFA